MKTKTKMNCKFSCKVPSDNDEEFEFLIGLAESAPECYLTGLNRVIVHETEPLKVTVITKQQVGTCESLHFIKYTTTTRQEIFIRSCELDSVLVSSIALAIYTFLKVRRAPRAETCATDQFKHEAIRFINTACDTLTFNMDTFPFKCPWCIASLEIPITFFDGIEFAPYNIKEQAEILCQTCAKPIQKEQMINGLGLALAKWTEILNNQREYYKNS